MSFIHQKLEKELSIYLGLKNTVLFSSCRNALYTLLLSLNLKESDEVIIQSFICDSLPNAIRTAGGKPVLVEVDEETFNLSPELVKKNINRNTKAVIFVHTYGNPSGILEIKEICDKNNLILIEDIAHALGASYDGKLAGTFGDYAVYSFTKQMVNFGGGALITNKEITESVKLREKLDKKSSFLVYLKRLMASLYEAKAFFLSKILIDVASKRANLKLANALDTHFNCSKIEAWLTLKQMKSLKINIMKRKRNDSLIRSLVKTQKIKKRADSSYNYLSFIFMDKERRDKTSKNNFLFLPPWQGSKVSNKLIFVPNNPKFWKRKLMGFVKTYKKFYNEASNQLKNEK